MDALRNTRGPFRAEHIRSGDPYELSNGHTVLSMSTGGRGALATGAGYKALADDPAVEDIGIDAGFSPVAETMRAPDLSIGKITDAPGWVHGIPKLAVEYADTGQDEPSLAQKIEDLLAAGTRYIWVVRLSGPRRIEVYEANQPMRKALPGEELDAPGVLDHPVRVEALYDLDVAGEVNFRHVLRRLTGHESLDAVRDEGKAEGKAEAVLAVLEARGVALDADARKQILSCSDLPVLDGWLRQATSATSVREIVDGS
jgi:hypothetical protein